MATDKSSPDASSRRSAPDPKTPRHSFDSSADAEPPNPGDPTVPIPEPRTPEEPHSDPRVPKKDEMPKGL
jgi:hypothetical protein